MPEETPEIPLNQSSLFHEHVVRQVLGNKYALKVARALCEEPALPLEDLVSILVHESDRLSVTSLLSEAHIAHYSGNVLRLTGYGISFMQEYRERIYR